MRFPYHPAASRLFIPGCVPSARNLSIDWSHPLAANLLYCGVPMFGGQVVDLVHPRGTNGATQGLRPRGPTATNYSFTAAQTPELDLTTFPWSVASAGYLSSAVSLASILSRYNYVNESNNQGWALYSRPDHSPSAFQFVIQNNNDITHYNLDTVTNQPAVGDWTIGGTTDGTTVKIFVNGIKDNSRTTGNFTAVSAPSAVLFCDTNWDGYISCIWNRALTEQDMLQFHFDPFCFLQMIGPNGRAHTTAVTGSISETLFRIRIAATGARFIPTIAQVLFRPTQLAAGKVGTSTPSDIFFSWRTD